MRSGNLRSRPFNLDTRIGRASEAASGIIVILALVTLVLHTVVTEGTTVDVWLGRAEIAFWGLFTVEYAMRIYSFAQFNAVGVKQSSKPRLWQVCQQPF